ncbi:MAG: hypothetical protein NC305_14245 [Lachnospiraceae bacterium]|nr:hypothetical protein [Butyrivibrio sp.]MCM1411690.1 hypothetical protein [Lachnospiraceae bacterium]
MEQYNLTEINQHLGKSFDLIICCCSFEKRCLSFLQNIDLCKIKKGLVFYNKDCIEHLEDNKRVLEHILGKKGIFKELLHSDPLFSADQMNSALNEIAAQQKIDSILLDITTFTHESLLMIIRLLHLRYPSTDIVCVYSNAQEYSSNQDVKEKWLSKGIVEIRSVLGYAGSMLPAKRTHLMLIVGYEYERATSIINELEPNMISLGFGKSDNATTQKNQDANEHYTWLVKRMATNYVDIDCFEIKCNDPFATKRMIIEKCKQFENTNILIVPLNNKISTIGVAMAAMDNEDIQVCYAPAQIYNYNNYSEPGDSCYLFTLNFLSSPSI